MAASLAWPVRTLTESDISTLEPSVSSSELAPQVLTEEPGVAIMMVTAEGKKRKIAFRVPHVPVPEWFVPTLEAAGPLLLLPFDWNRSGSPPIDKSAIQSALDGLWSFMGDRSSAPQWTPTRSGGVQLEWHERGIDLEIEFAPNAAGGYAVFGDNEQIEPDWDGPIADNLERLRALLNKRLAIE